MAHKRAGVHNSKGLEKFKRGSKNALNNRSIDLFEVDAADNLFIDPQHSYAKMKLRIRNADNTPLAAWLQHYGNN